MPQHDKPWWKRALRLKEDVGQEQLIVQDQNMPRQVNLRVTNEGSYGTEVQAGYLYEEYLQRLQGYTRAIEFDKMRRGDYQIKMCLNAVKFPISSAVWEIKPFDDSPEAAADADLVRHILFNDLNRSWRKFVHEALTICEFGFAPFEITHKVVMNHAKFGSYIGVNLGWRSPKTIHRFNVKPDGVLESITQYAYGDLDSTVDIPAEWVLLFNLEQEGANYEGIPLIRPCYGNYRRKDVYLKLNAIGIEKFAVPTPIATIPDQKQNSTQYDNMIATLQKYTTHQANYITKPAGWEIELNNNAYDPQKVEVSIDNEDKRMTKAFLASFLELGQNGVGSYALSNDLSDFFLGGLESIANEIKDPINDKLIPHIVEMNRGKRDGYPKLCSSGISDKIGKEFAEVLKLFIDGKVITPDDPLEASIRKRLNLGEKSSIGIRQPDPAPSGFGFSERIKLAEERRKRLKLIEDENG